MDLGVRERGVGARAGSICGARNGEPACMHVGYVDLLSILWIWFLPKSNLVGVSKLPVTSNVTAILFAGHDAFAYSLLASLLASLRS